MTEYQYADMIATYSSNAGAFFAMYITVLSGYLIAAFMAGQKLNWLQITILNIGFIITILVLTWGTYGAGMTQVYYTNLLLELDASAPQANRPWVMKTILSLMGGGTAAALFFMWNVRHTKNE